MTALADCGVSGRRAVPRPLPWRGAPLVVGASALTLLMFWPLVLSVWHGAFGDPDDAMRLEQVRAWMAGQSWFDLRMMRLDPPTGASMHWSRLIDVPNSALIRLFGLFTTEAHAEALDRIVLPSLWIVGLYLGMVRLATVLLGRSTRGLALWGTLLSGTVLVQFQPGRIGHHAPETLCLVFSVGAALASFDPRRAREAIVAGALVALALAISLETLPLLAALGLAMVGAWIWRGRSVARPLACFGIGLGFALPLVFLVSVPPDGWQVVTADAFGIAHLDAGVIAAAGCLAIALTSDRLKTPIARCMAASLLAVALVGFLAIFAPALLAGPFANVDPLVRATWLDHVVESRPLFAIAQERPVMAFAVAMPVLLGLTGCLATVVRSRETDRLRFAALSLMVGVGLGIGLWQIRGFASITPLALCGGIAAAAWVRDRLTSHGPIVAGVLAGLTILPFASTFWILALPDRATAHNARACLAPDALSPLADLPAGRAVAPLESGSHLIEATSLDVFAAPYHRNNDGNRLVLDIWRATPTAARNLLADRQVTYVVTCPEAGDFDQIADRNPHGLAAALRAGRIPPFLTPVPIGGTPYRVFRVTAP